MKICLQVSEGTQQNMFVHLHTLDRLQKKTKKKKQQTNTRARACAHTQNKKQERKSLLGLNIFMP